APRGAAGRAGGPARVWPSGWPRSPPAGRPKAGSWTARAASRGRVAGGGRHPLLPVGPSEEAGQRGLLAGASRGGEPVEGGEEAAQELGGDSSGGTGRGAGEGEGMGVSETAVGER